MKRPRLRWMVLFSFTTILYCSKNKFPEVTNWIGIELKNDGQVEKIFKTVGEGQGEITWWAGGYIYENGYFEIELIDLKTKKSILKKQYQRPAVST